MKRRVTFVSNLKRNLDREEVCFLINSLVAVSCLHQMMMMVVFYSLSLVGICFERFYSFSTLINPFLVTDKYMNFPDG